MPPNPQRPAEGRGSPRGPHAHGPDDDEHPALTAAYARAGLWLFAAYLLLYGAFVGVNAFAPEVMARRPAGGLNLAISTGLGLIAAALVLALVYMAACRWIAERHREAQGRGRGQGPEQGHTR